MIRAEKIWMDGKMVNWDDAKVHVLTHTLHYGTGVFEGIRAYEGHDGKTAVFRLKEHVKRLFQSAKINFIKIPFTESEIVEAIKEVLRANKLKAAYIRPLAFIGDGKMGLSAFDNPIHVIIAAWPWETYLGDHGVEHGVRGKISSFTRMGINSILSKAKSCANYINSVWAKQEALKAGYEEAVLLDAQGYIAEAAAENIFIVTEGIIRTPSLGLPVLRGLTRDCVIKIAQDLGHTVKEDLITRDDAYISDEIFLCGTAAEIVPMRELDDRTIGDGKPGPITKKIQKIYLDAVRGKVEKYKAWLDYI